MNERQLAHLAYCLERLEYWNSCKPTATTARRLAVRDADEAYPLKSEE